MKKLFAICLALVMVLSLSVTAMAASDSFVNSPSNNSAPDIVDCTNDSEDCTADIIIYPYGDRDKLTPEEKSEMEEVYKQIVDSVDLLDLFSGLDSVVNPGTIETDLAVSDIFHVNYSDCDAHDIHGSFKIKLSSETFNGFVGLIQYLDGEWSIVPDAKLEDGNYLVFSADELSTFAIVVDRTKAETTSPITGDPTANYILAAGIFAVCCVAMVSVVVVNKKKA